MNWPDAEAVLVAWLASALGVRVCTDTPADLAEVLPLLRVRRIGGTDDGFRIDHALVDVDAFGPSRVDASALAARTRAALLDLLPGSTAAGAVVTAAGTVSAPARRPWENPNVHRFGATYTLHLHTA
ncbi:hypothetical protein [Streptomyces luteireticuli]|uniref:DUF3168 domain-containing protein n=1 Tax=Streptomyces luteireticuli TaxID=173858 RepID=A0ABN0YZF5_9ACTN